MNAARRELAFSRLRRLAPAIGLAIVLGGCGSMNERMSEALGSAPGIGLPTAAPERPAAAERPAFPAVHEMPPQRTTAVLTADEQRRAERELVAAREGQRNPAPAAEAPAAPALAPVASPRKPVIQPRPVAPKGQGPASSSQSIY